MKLSFNLNGRPVETEYEHQETLAEVLRERMNLTGTKISCEVQVCGACTVLVDGLPVSSCTLLAYEARGRSVVTIEGLAKPDGALHPIQQAFIDEFAFQCGFCTPGMILAAKALLDENPQPHAIKLFITWTAISAAAPAMSRSCARSRRPRTKWHNRLRNER